MWRSVFHLLFLISIVKGPMFDIYKKEICRFHDYYDIYELSAASLQLVLPVFFHKHQKSETACQTFCEVRSSSPALGSIVEQMAAINFLICSQSDSKFSCPYTWNWSSYFPLMTLGFGEVLWEWWCLVRCGRQTVGQLVWVHHHDKIIALHATPKSNHNYICKLWVNWRWKCLIRKYEAS